MSVVKIIIDGYFLFAFRILEPRVIKLSFYFLEGETRKSRSRGDPGEKTFSEDGRNQAERNLAHRVLEEMGRLVTKNESGQVRIHIFMSIESLHEL